MTQVPVSRPAAAVARPSSATTRSNVRPPAPRAARPTSPPQPFLRWFAVAVLVLASGAFFAILGPGGGDTTRPEIFLLWIIAYLVAGALLLDGRLRLRRPVPTPLPLMLFVALAGSSVLWSASPGLTLRRSVGLFGTVLVGVLLAQRLRPIDVFDAVRRAMLVVAGTSLLLFVVQVPAAFDPVHGTLRGVVATKNTLGQVMAIGVLACAAVALIDARRTKRCVLSALPMGLALALTDSTAGVLTAGLVAACTVIVIMRRGVAGRVTLGGAAAAMAGLLMMTLPGTSPERLAGVVGEDTTLTGRDVIWQQATEAGLEQPLLGHGYGSFWTATDAAERIRARLEWEVPHAHNGLLDVALDLGLVGVLVAVLLMGALVVRGVLDLLAGHRDYAVLRLSIAGLIVLANLVESAFLQQNSLLGVLLVTALAARRPRSPVLRARVP